LERRSRRPVPECDGPVEAVLLISRKAAGCESSRMPLGNADGALNRRRSAHFRNHGPGPAAPAIGGLDACERLPPSIRCWVAIGSIEPRTIWFLYQAWFMHHIEIGLVPHIRVGRRALPPFDARVPTHRSAPPSVGLCKDLGAEPVRVCGEGINDESRPGPAPNQLRAWFRPMFPAQAG